MYVLKNTNRRYYKLQTERLLKNDNLFVNIFVMIEEYILLDTLPAHVHLSLTVTKQ